MTSRPYFAYGSNLFEPQMSNRCPGTKILGRAQLRGWQFIINDWGVASIVKKPGAVVWGLVWDISAEHETTLDVFEGVAEGHYTKEQVSVRLIDETPKVTLNCLTYVSRNAFRGRSRPDYLDTRILPAAKKQRFPMAYQSQLKRWI